MWSPRSLIPCPRKFATSFFPKQRVRYRVLYIVSYDRHSVTRGPKPVAKDAQSVDPQSVVTQIPNPSPERVDPQSVDPQSVDPQSVVTQIQNPLPERVDPQRVDPQSVDP